MRDAVAASCLVAVVAFRLASLFSAHCDLDEFGARLAPLQRRLDQGLPAFEGAPALASMPLPEVMANPTAAPILDVVSDVARDMAEHHLPFVMRQVPSITALHRRWSRRYLLQKGEATAVNFVTYRGKRFKYHNRGSLERMQREEPRLAEVITSRDEHGANLSKNQTMSSWMRGDKKRVYGRVVALDEDRVRDALGFIDPIIAGRWRRQNNTSTVRMGFAEIQYALHWDMLPNFLVQVSGTKSVVLFHPLEESRLPWERNESHPHFRQGSLWPRDDALDEYTDVRAMQVTLSPGDVLYIPPFWFHYIEAIPDDGMWITINQWLNETTDDDTMMRCPPQRWRP